MDQSLTFARHFARLIGLLLHESANIAEQKAALRALVAASRTAAVSLTLKGWQVQVNGADFPPTFPGAQDLAAQMYGHSVTEIQVTARAAPGEVLEVARSLVKEPMPGGGGRALAARVAEIAPKTIRVAVQLPLDDDEDGAAAPRLPAPPFNASDAPAPRPSGSYLAFAATQAPTSSIPELFAELERTRSASAMSQLLEDITTLIEKEFEAGNIDAVAEGMAAIAAGEQSRTDAGHRRAYTLALRRLNRKPVLRALAGILPRRRERASEYVAVLGYMGTSGTDVLIEELTAADSASDRRVYFDALVTLNSGAPELIHMLGDPRWYVIRNAAELLGEMGRTEADAALAALVAHEDERVRRAAVGALAKLHTPSAYAALRSSMRDLSPQVRLLAAAGLASRTQNTAAHTLTKALAVEEDGDVQMQIVATLGRVSTPDAVQELIAIAESPGGWFKKTPAGLRVAAVEALGDARSPLALAALNRLRSDKDPDVREVAKRVITGMRRGAKATG
jgi:hypothetical protein